MDNTRTIFFVPESSDIATFNLNDSEVNALLSSLPCGCVEVEPGSGVYTVHDMESVTKAYDSLFTK